MLQSTLRLAVAVCAMAIVATYVMQQKLPVERGEPSRPGAQTPATQPAARIDLATAAAPRQTPRGGGGIEYLTADPAGHFAARIEIDGVSVETLVDTGATLVAFGEDDAEKVGIRPQPGDFKYRTRTANGEVPTAAVKVRRMRLGSIELTDVDAAVLPRGAFSGTLLGMSFLRRLASFQIEGRTLVLRQ